jgi:hypothetical protein
VFTAHMAKSTAQDLAGARGHFVTAGTPEQIADLIEDLVRRWVQRDAPILPAQFDVFAGEVVPILQRRGLFRTEYTGSMLRDHYGLRWPASVFDDPAWISEPLAAAAGV